MTVEEAIRFLTIEKEGIVALKDSVNSNNTDYFEKHEEAYVIAIKAIDENAKLKKAVGKIKEEINDLVGYGAYYKGVNDVVDIIKKHTEWLI